MASAEPSQATVLAPIRVAAFFVADEVRADDDGLCAATARRLAQMGAKVVIVAEGCDALVATGVTPVGVWL